MKIIPDEIPEDAAPLDAQTSLLDDAATTKRQSLMEGKNMFVTLLTGEFKVGRIEYVDANRFTVGNSEPIPFNLVEFARET